MNNQVNTKLIHDIFRKKCSLAIAEHHAREGNQQIIVRLGEFTEDVVSSTLCLIESKMEEWGERKGVIKKVFSTVVEQLQNIRINCVKDETGQKPGFIIVSRHLNDYYITTLNLSNNDNATTIRNKLKKIKGLKYEEVKRLYMDTLSEGKISEKGGAGLGFITIALKSNNNIHCDMETLNEAQTLISMNVKISNE